MTDAATTAIDLGPIANVLLPIALSAASALAVAGIHWCIGEAKKRGLEINAAEEKAADDLAAKLAGVLLAQATTALGAKSITIKSPEIKGVVNFADEYLSDEFSKTKMTDDELAARVVAQIGKLQPPPPLDNTLRPASQH
jgi:hypothetical protein